MIPITLAQITTHVGALEANTQAILAAYGQTKEGIVATPELSLTGYPPEDLILHPHFLEEVEWYLQTLVKATENQPHALLIGAPVLRNGKRHNAALLLGEGKILAEIHKHHLPNYGVFDERRVFDSAPIGAPIAYKNHTIGVIICEDTWHADTTRAMRGADVMLSINASPFESGKNELRLEAARRAVQQAQAPVYYLNAMHAQDDIVFDGGSFVMDKAGEVVTQLPFFCERVQESGVRAQDDTESRILNPESLIYSAQMLALKTYVERNGFPGVMIGMSGGVDSALSAAIAVDALGKDRVKLVYMPSRFSSAESTQDAKDAALRLGDIPLEIQPIEPLVAAFHAQLPLTGLAAENLQSRLRGMLLMALSNTHGHMVLTTGNKSEMAVGYATLYGDMCGGYNVLKDCYKTTVFELCKWRNANVPQGSKLPWLNIIPENIITKAPTAELRENQKDQDSLPPYDVLDGILQLLIEGRKSADDIIAQGYTEETVHKVATLVKRAEYKRRQSAPGVKLTCMPFTRDRRMPITG